MDDLSIQYRCFYDNIYEIEGYVNQLKAECKQMDMKFCIYRLSICICVTSGDTNKKGKIWKKMK